IRAAVPKELPELAQLGRSLWKRHREILAYFDVGASNGPVEAINGRLEHLRGIALGFRNLNHYILRHSSTPASSKTESMHSKTGRAIKDQPGYRCAGLNGEDVGIPASERLGAGTSTCVSPKVTHPDFFDRSSP